MVEYTLPNDSGEVLVKTITAYGLRNVQLVAMRLKKRHSSMEKVAFVEIMACPGGELFGFSSRDICSHLQAVGVAVVRYQAPR